MTSAVTTGNVAGPLKPAKVIKATKPAPKKPHKSK